MNRSLLTALLGLVSAATVAAQATWYVDDDACPGPGSGTEGDPFCSIQAGIDAASDTDTVQVAAGTYNEFIDFSGKAITLQSTDGADVTTIDASGLSRSVVKCVSSEGADTVLDGFRITGGRAVQGAGMSNRNSSPTLNNCIFTGNSASSGGGGMSNWDSSPTLNNCIFIGNRVTPIGGGGGIYNTMNSNPTVNNCIFSVNWANSGGGMDNSVSNPTLTNCTFTGNSATSGGGMINSGGSPTLTNCTFSGNSATHTGGGIHSGGLDNYESSPTLTNCTFTGNSASDGGGMYNIMNSSPTLTNCTFSGNRALESGGGLFNEGTDATLANCILWANTAQSDLQIHGSATVTYSCVQDGWPGTGNISATPRFTTAFSLAPGSPCIDAGSNAAVPADSHDLDGDGDTTEPCPLDLRGLPRFYDDLATPDTGQGTTPIVDLGAYEYVVVVPAGSADLDADGDVDLADFALFVQKFDPSW